MGTGIIYQMSEGTNITIRDATKNTGPMRALSLIIHIVKYELDYDEGLLLAARPSRGYIGIASKINENDI